MRVVKLDRSTTGMNVQLLVKRLQEVFLLFTVFTLGLFQHKDILFTSVVNNE